MLKNPTDNYYSVQQAIAKRVLATPLASSIGYGGIGSHGYNEILAIANGEKSDRYGYASVEFRRADTSCELYIRTDSRNDFVSTRETDADGNEWVTYGLKVEVSYPSHGSADPATVLARMNLVSQVAMLAAEINAEFGGRNEIRKMVASKMEVDSRALKAEQEALRSKLHSFVNNNSKGMRAGGKARDFGAGMLNGMPVGVHTVGIGDHQGNIKNYKFVVRDFNGTLSASLYRIS
jgi:hypothetical protein